MKPSKLERDWRGLPHDVRSHHRPQDVLEIHRVSETEISLRFLGMYRDEHLASYALRGERWLLADVVMVQRNMGSGT